MLSASRRQPHLLHGSAVDRRQTWSMDKSWRCVTLSGFLQSQSSLSVKPHFSWHALQWPWPVRKRFSSDHWRLWRSKPGSRIMRSTTKVELTTVADCQSSLHRLVTSIDCRMKQAYAGQWPAACQLHVPLVSSSSSIWLLIIILCACVEAPINLPLSSTGFHAKFGHYRPNRVRYT